MPTPFDNINFAEHKQTYVGLPVQEFIQSASILNERYEQAVDAKDKLDTLASTFKVDEPNKVHLKNRLDAIRNKFEGVVKSGAYEHAMPVVKEAYKELATDKALTTSLEHYAFNQQLAEELNSAYTGKRGKKLLDYEQYQDRMNTLKSYKGIGEPDDLGYYPEHPYSKESIIGTPYVDLQEIANSALVNYTGGDVYNSTTSSLGYSSYGNYTPEQMKQLGIASSRTTTNTVSVDGLEAASLVDSAIKANPDAMAYIKDKVRIHNQNNPQQPITEDMMIARYRDDALAKEGKNSIAVAAEDLGVNIADARVKSSKRTGTGDDDMPEAAISFHMPVNASMSKAGSLQKGLGSGIGRVATNWADLIGGIADFVVGGSELLLGQATNILGGRRPNDPSNNVLVADGQQRYSQGINRMFDWHNEVSYAKLNYSQLEPAAKNNLNNLIYLHGDNEMIEAMRQVNNDFSKLPDPVIKRFMSSPQIKANYESSIMSSNMYATPHTASGVQIKDILFKGSTLDEIAQNHPAVAALPGYDPLTGKVYENYNEWRNDVGTGNNAPNVGKMKIGNVAESMNMNNLYAITGDSRFLTNMAVQVGDRSFIMGTGPIEDETGLHPMFASNDPAITDEYITRSYVTLGYNKAIAKAPKMSITEQIKSNIEPTEILNPFSGTGGKLEVYAETVPVSQAGGERLLHRFRIKDPNTGVVVESGQTIELVIDGKLQRFPVGDSYDDVLFTLADINYYKYKDQQNNPYYPSSIANVQ